MKNQATLGIRPEFVECLTAPQPEALPATLHSARDFGTHTLAEFRLGPHTVAAKLRTPPAPGGGRVWLRFPPQRTLYYVDDKRVA